MPVTGAQRNPWIPWDAAPFQPSHEHPCTVRIFCFPHAGGAANSYLPWARQSAGQAVRICPVELPGHGTRMREPMPTEIDELVDGLVDGLGEEFTRGPFALFGHSLGAAVAYALAARLQGGAARPGQLLVSGALPPGNRAPSMLSLSDAELITTMADLDGTPAEILENPGMMAFFAERFRTDLRLLASAEQVPLTVLDLPIHGFAGDGDALATPSAMRQWQALSRSGFTLRVFPGGHFYLHEHGDELLGCLAGAARVPGIE